MSTCYIVSRDLGHERLLSVFLINPGEEYLVMMTLIFLLILVAMVMAYFGKGRLSCVVFAVSLALSLYWLHHHATDALNILL